jgi:cell migration-inducing and hyaluronan-binding protein
MKSHDICRRWHALTIGSLTAMGWLLAAGLLLLGAQAAEAAEYVCGNGDLPTLQPPDIRDLKVTGRCSVQINHKSYFGNVNIVEGGVLLFRESNGPGNSQTDFWASSIIIENGGAMTADGGPDRPYGINGGTLTIHLYGINEAVWNPVTEKFDKQNAGAPCKSDPVDSKGMAQGPCGVDRLIWESNGSKEVRLPINDDKNLPITDYFYQYGPLRGDAKCDDGTIWNNGQCGTQNGKVGYFGNKVLAVSFGGQLLLNGYKGATSAENNQESDPTYSGWSWTRLHGSLNTDASTLVVDIDLKPAGDQSTKWTAGDEIVVTTTDYLPGHSEVLQVSKVYDSVVPDLPGVHAVDFVVEGSPGIRWPHNGKRFGLRERLPDRLKQSLDPELVREGAETRAAVALLTRSIRIISAGDTPTEDFRGGTYSYGAHMIVRQGAAKVQVRGVEFKQMGQGGRLAHYPVHFHMARKTAGHTYIKDSSINDSMTRWIVIHSTQGVTLARNVGYKSIGHGFYLEDGTETDNKFYSNIGIFARAAVDNVQNHRNIPGILADNQDPFGPDFQPPNVPNPGFPYRSDVEYPSVFWITNGWNDFIGNMAAGAGACGAAYWLVPAANMNMTDVSAGNDGMMKWSGYAALQRNRTYAGTTPLKSFYKNYATSAMHSFQTTSDAPNCDGVIAADAKPGKLAVVRAVHSIAPKPVRQTVRPPGEAPHDEPDNYNDHYYPHVLGGARKPTHCPDTPSGPDCSVVPPCANGVAAERCGVVVLDHFTTAFHWANGSVSAIWLRPFWYLLTNSVISDVQNGGLTFVSGGDYTHSSMIKGYWALATNSVFIGNTRDNKTFPFSSNVGPFNAASRLNCDKSLDGVPGYCLSAKEGISMPTAAFFTNQRLSNIYDGPSYQDSNAYLDITTADCPVRGYGGPCMYGTGVPHLLLRKKPGVEDNSQCYLPNAAIGWKQPNGFFYPPAFHSRNLFFDNVDLRHYVIAPLFKVPDGVTGNQDFGQGGTYLTDVEAVKKQYCFTGNTEMFNDWTSIDRQTELNDDDGSLTGLSNSINVTLFPEFKQLKQTISINEDSFFSAPIETAECGSSLGVNSDAASACTAPVADKPPMTARTSPYDYVATVVYHKSSDDNKTDLWGSDCANPGCYGVPLFRQYLTGAGRGAGSTREWGHWYANGCDKDPSTPQCRWPFIRMAGSNFSQRETLTINNGVYYLDTTVSEKSQRTENYTKRSARSLNVFKAGQTYYMFFVYAKETTAQTYKIYVGKDFDTTNGLKAVHVDITTKDLQFEPYQGGPPGWLVPDYSQVKDTGILTVQFNFKGIGGLDPTPEHGLCQPATFCKPSQDQKMCVSALADGDRLKAVSEIVCGRWAMKDLDCPPFVRDGASVRGGCYGISFTLPPRFQADDLYRRPTPGSFPSSQTNDQGHPSWGVRFLRTLTLPDATGGRCFYPKLPHTDCDPP